MKRSMTITISAITLIIFTAFSFMSDRQANSAWSMLGCDQMDTTGKQNNLNYIDFKDSFNGQDVYFFVSGTHGRSVTKGKLADVNFINDFVTGFPLSWISDYTSVEMTVSKNGKEVTVTGLNNTLTLEQKELVNSVNISDDIIIKVKHKMKNAATDEIENRHIDIFLTVVPEVQAKYVGGYNQMTTYLKENSLDKIYQMNLQESPQLSILFNVNREGEIIDVELTKTSGHIKLDDLLIDLITNMSKWSPAENVEGIAISQQFELSIGFGLGGC